MSENIITPQLVSLDVDYGSTPREVIEHLAQQAQDAGRASDSTKLADAAFAREQRPAPA